MTRVLLSAFLALALLAAPLAAEAQPRGQVYRIGYLCRRSGGPARRGLPDGLRELGYVEGGISFSRTAGRTGGSTAARLAAELVASRSMSSWRRHAPARPGREARDQDDPGRMASR